MKTIISALLILVSTLSFAAEDQSISFAEELVLELNKIKVSPSDRMKIEYLNNFIVRLSYGKDVIPKELVFKKIKIVFLKTFKNAGRYYSDAEYNKLINLFRAAGDDAYKKLLAYYKKVEDDYLKYKSLSWEETKKISIKLVKEQAVLLKLAVSAFNNAVLESEEARKRIALACRPFIKDDVAKKVRYQRLYRKNIKPSFIYVFGVSGGGDYYGCYSLGLRYSKYFLNAANKFNVGLVFDNYYNFSTHYSYTGYYIISRHKYLSLDALISFKFYTKYIKSSLMLNLGISTNFKVSGSDSTIYRGHEIKYTSFFPSAVFELGYLYTSKSFKFSLFASLFLKADLAKKHEGYYDGKNIFFGLKFGLGFGL